MRIESRTLHGFQVLAVKDDLTLHSDCTPLRDKVSSLVKGGHSRIALSLTPDSFLCSRTIAAIIQCVEYAREAGGTFVLLNPSQEIANAFQLVGIKQLMKVCSGEDELAGL
jgi:anti-anti-sigma factor